jgi:BirA family transcriptional regulator, biotin operon repressor / biotin---[acetyl-CoA-carboxylase] ligase
MNPPLSPLDPAVLRQAMLAPDGEYARVELVAQTGSTNADLVTAAASGQWPDLAVLVAENQLAGRGRLDRQWSTATGSSAIASVLLRPEGDDRLPPLPQESYSWITLLAAVALCEALAVTAGLNADLKWPNDVLVDGRKIAGILAQLVPAPAPTASTAGAVSTAGPAVVVGTGINVGQSQDELPVPTATSLALEDATTLDRNALLPDYLNRFARLYRSFRTVGGDPGQPLEGDSSLLELVSARMVTLGSEVRAELPGGLTLQGRAVGLDRHGSLLVADSAGITHAVSAGDVVHLRRHEAQGPGAYA